MLSLSLSLPQNTSITSLCNYQIDNNFKIYNENICNGLPNVFLMCDFVCYMLVWLSLHIIIFHMYYNNTTWNA